MKKLVEFAKNEAPILARTAVGLSGVGLFSFGAWLAWHPAGFMLPGAFFVWVALVLGVKVKS